MFRTLLKLLSAAAVCGIALSAESLTILPTFDGSITNDPNGAAMMAAINHAISVFQSNITDDVTVKILFQNNSTISLGQSDTYGAYYSYSDYLTALRSHATSVNDNKGLSQIPNTSTDPVVGGNQIYINKALARLMGLDTGYGSDGFDSTIGVKMSLVNFSRPPTDSDKFDLAEVVEHEMDEVLGTPSDMPYDLTQTSPIDLFRYTTNLVRTLTMVGDDAYFSVDGTNLLARFNMLNGADYSDWWSAGETYWAPPGFTPVPQVQDAFGTPGSAHDQGSNELAMLDVIGWTLATPAAQPSPSLRIVHSGTNQYALSWSNSVAGFTLQERTNLAVGAWTASTTGTNNPAVLTSTVARKYYRLFKSSSLVAPSASPAVIGRPLSPEQHRIYTYQPSKS